MTTYFIDEPLMNITKDDVLLGIDIKKTPECNDILKDVVFFDKNSEPHVIKEGPPSHWPTKKEVEALIKNYKEKGISLFLPLVYHQPFHKPLWKDVLKKKFWHPAYYTMIRMGALSNHGWLKLNAKTDIYELINNLSKLNMRTPNQYFRKLLHEATATLNERTFWHVIVERTKDKEQLRKDAETVRTFVSKPFTKRLYAYGYEVLLSASVIGTRRRLWFIDQDRKMYHTDADIATEELREASVILCNDTGVCLVYPKEGAIPLFFAVSAADPFEMKTTLNTLLIHHSTK